jgi:hypothetical protein
VIYLTFHLMLLIRRTLKHAYIILVKFSLNPPICNTTTWQTSNTNT